MLLELSCFPPPVLTAVWPEACPRIIWAAKSGSAVPPAVARARQFIERHHGDPIGLSDIAAAAAMSPFHLSRLFRRALGVTLMEFLASTRLDSVKRQFDTDPHVRVSEAAFAAGFQSLSQFNRLFYRHVGMPPSHYRSTHGRTVA